MNELDLMLRGGTAALCFFVAIRWLLNNHTHPVPIFGAAFEICVGIYVIMSHPVINPDGFHSIGILCFLGKLTAPFFWLFTLALFDDRFRLRAGHAAPFIAIALLHYGILIFEPVIINLASHLLMVSLFAHVLLIAVQSEKCDLVDKRIKFRKVLTLLVPVVGISIAVMDLASGGEMSQLSSLIQISVIFTVAFGFAMWNTQIDGGLIPEDETAKPPAQTLTAPDRIELTRLNTAVEGGICFEPGLTITTLAAEIDVPEHRLRRLINQGLGYRNFNAFLNDHRVAEAQRRLSDPERAREQIIQHAYALGYASLAPFNRAFRERLGTSPSAYRNEALDRVLAE